MHISEAQLSQKSYWNRGILIEWLQLPSNEKAKQSTEEERGEPPSGLLSPWPYARHHTKRQGFVGEQGGEMSRPMGGLRWQLKPEHSFSIEFSWHTASNAFSCRTARKKIKVVLISSNMKKKKKKEEALPCHCITLLAYEKKERKNLFLSHTRRTVSVSHFGLKTLAQGKGKQTHLSSVQSRTWGIQIMPDFTRKYFPLIPSHIE